MAVEISQDPTVGIFTFQDAMEHLILFASENTSRRFRSDIINSIVQAYEEVGSIHDWQYLLQHHRVQVPARIDLTIDYLQTGGTTAERECQITGGGDFPVWVKYARIKEGNIVYEVEDQYKPSVCNLTPDKNPGEDRTAVPWVFYQNVFPLPRDFRRIGSPMSEERWGAARYMTPDEWVYRERFQYYSGSTRAFTIMGNTDNTGGMSLVIDPPQGDESIDFVYIRQPRRLKITGEQTNQQGTDATAAGNATTIPGSKVTADMVGCIVRLASNAELPTGVAGKNVYSEQRRVIKVDTGTGILTVDRDWEETYTGNGFLITDPIDLPYACRDAFWRCCEWKVGIVRRFQQAQQLQTTWMTALRLAKERDSYQRRLRAAQGQPGAGSYYADYRVNF